MPTAPKIVQLPYTYWTDRASAPVVAIVAHNTVGVDSRKYLSQGGPRKVSIHSLIQKDGTIYRMVPDERGANHAGFGKMPDGYPRINPNRCTLSFELENASDGKGKADPYPDIQLLSMGWEINRIRAKFGHLPIFRHADLDPTRRSDTVGLDIATMEKWANAAALVYGPAVPRRYIVQGLPVYERSDHTGKLWGRLMPGQVVVIDDPANGHVAQVDGVAGGIGFVDMDGIEALP